MITRRSAGIPALLVALICADSSKVLVDKAIADLLNIASRVSGGTQSDGASLPQVHAMNSLKVLFSSSKVASSLNKHIVKVMEMSAGSMASSRYFLSQSLYDLRLLIAILDGPLETAA